MLEVKAGTFVEKLWSLVKLGQCELEAPSQIF